MRHRRWYNGNFKYVALGLLTVVTVVVVILALTTRGPGQPIDVSMLR